MGGIHTGYLGQDGTTFNVPGFQPHQGVIETISPPGNGSPVPVGIIAHPGDSFYASTLWDPSASKFFYYMQDNTTGAVSSNQSRVVSADQQNVEVISERPIIGYDPSGNPIYSQLTNFQPIAVQQATAYWGSSSSGFSGIYNNAITMVDRGGTLLAQPSLIDSNSDFNTYWYNCV
jgi:hypothetical protein